MSTGADIDAAVKAATQAFKMWSSTPVPKRARILFRYQQLLVEHWTEFAEIITKENGKAFKEAYGEVQRGIECVEFAAGVPTLMMGTQLPDIATDMESGVYRYPVGVVGGITPFNFPMMVPCWMFPLAIACGNTFVLKPSERTPLAANRLAELFREAGLPDGVLNVVHGGREAVNGIIEHPGITAVSFVGSQPVAEHVYKTAAANGKRVQALAGAKNHTIVMTDANLDLAVKEIIGAAFGSAGERCMACSVVVAVDNIADELVSRLVASADKIRIGNGLDEGVFLGPVIRDAHLAKTVGYIEIGEREGAQLVRDGRADDLKSTGSGYFVGPTIFDHVQPTMQIKFGRKRFLHRSSASFGPRTSTRGLRLPISPISRMAHVCSRTAQPPCGNSVRKWMRECLGSTSVSRHRWPSSRSPVGRSHFMVTSTPMAAMGSSSILVARWSRPDMCNKAS